MAEEVKDNAGPGSHRNRGLGDFLRRPGPGPEGASGSGESEGRIEGVGGSPSSGPNSSASDNGGARNPEGTASGTGTRETSEASYGNSLNDVGRRGSTVRDHEDIPVDPNRSGSDSWAGDFGSGESASPVEQEVKAIIKMRDPGGTIVSSEPEKSEPILRAAPVVVKGKTPTKPPAIPPKKGKVEPPKDGALSQTEITVFSQALVDFSDLADAGLWHLGLDTDSDMPAMDGNPGVPIWHMDIKEAEIVTNLFITLGKNRPEVYKAMRSVVEAHKYMQAGVILGSRFMETVLRVFETGIQFRISKPMWMKQYMEAKKNAEAIS